GTRADSREPRTAPTTDTPANTSPARHSTFCCRAWWGRLASAVISTITRLEAVAACGGMPSRNTSTGTARIPPPAPSAPTTIPTPRPTPIARRTSSIGGLLRAGARAASSYPRGGAGRGPAAIGSHHPSAGRGPDPGSAHRPPGAAGPCLARDGRADRGGVAARRARAPARRGRHHSPAPARPAQVRPAALPLGPGAGVAGRGGRALRRLARDPAGERAGHRADRACRPRGAAPGPGPRDRGADPDPAGG